MTFRSSGRYLAWRLSVSEARPSGRAN
jgi:hypothetical protein